MDTRILADLRDYWDRLRGDRIAPYRAELDPRSFESALEHMFILERLHPTQVRIRLAGMRICEIMGMEVRGMPPEALIAAADRQTLTNCLDQVFSTPAIAELDLLAADSTGMTSPARLLVLPLRSDFGEMTRAIGCLASEQQALKPPVAFSISAQRTTQIVGSGSDRQALPGFAEEASPYQPAGGEQRRPQLTSVAGGASKGSTPAKRGHLRVVK